MKYLLRKNLIEFGNIFSSPGWGWSEHPVSGFVVYAGKQFLIITFYGLGRVIRGIAQSPYCLSNVLRFSNEHLINTPLMKLTSNASSGYFGLIKKWLFRIFLAWLFSNLLVCSPMAQFLNGTLHMTEEQRKEK